MNTKLSLQNQKKVVPTFEKKKENIMISKIDRKRIFIFVIIAYDISIILALVIFMNGGIYTSFPTKIKPLANILMAVGMFAPMVAHIATRLITRAG